MKKRRCIDCEYYDKKDNWQGYCLYHPPKFSGAQGASRLPKTSEDAYCSTWEPKWDDNEMVARAWEDFLIVQKLVTGGKKD